MMFDVDVAKEYGVNEAIMIKNFQFWISKNKANDQNIYEGHCWTYNSVKGWAELFPFWTAKQVRIILDSLIEKGVLQKGNYNNSQYDRTTWYAFVNEEKWICLNGQMDLPKKANGFAQNNQPIPDNITDIPPDNNIIINNNILSAPPKGTMAKPTLEELQAYIKEKGYTFDAESFIAYYDSNGWMIGKQKMKNWKAACITWQRNGFNRKPVEEKKKEFYW